MFRKIIYSIALLAISMTGNAQDYPHVMGYAGGQSVLHEGAGVADTFNVSYSGGSPFATQWNLTNDLGNELTQDYALSGFRHDVIYAESAFNEDLFASKGYYGDFVQLSWNLIRYETQVTSFKVYRKILGSTEDSTLVANLPGAARDWQDQFAESGTMYKYTLVVNGISPFKKKFLTYIESVGFRVPYGSISGRVTYDGGAAVAGVSIIADTDDDFDGNSIYLNGTDAYLAISHEANAPYYQLDTAFTFQAWFNPDGGTGTQTLMEKGGQYKVEYNPGVVSFTAGGSQTIVVPFTPRVDTFFHVAAMKTADSIKLFVLYDRDEVYSTSELLTASVAPNNDDVLIGKDATGNFFKGEVDEVRIWHASFEEQDLFDMSSMYISGTEDHLSGYYRMNEGVGNVFYDLSRKGFQYNEYHGYMSPTCAWSNAIAGPNQLAVKGITDMNGNYIVSGIPYATDGSLYTFTPVFGVHSFDPTEQTLFMGQGSVNHSNVNFTDVASFPVIGEVYYKDTYFPVEGVSIKIDGQTAVDSDGLPITTNSTGQFIVDVPIGQHFIRLVKNGHEFENGGRFPAQDSTTFDFQAPHTFQVPFYDTTKVKVIGKMVGGTIQAEKPKGLGQSVNNLGPGSIKLGTQKGYDLTTNASGVSMANDNAYYMGDSVVVKGSTVQQTAGFGVSPNPTAIEILPDPTKGEYTAYLLPEKYTVTSAIAGSYTFGSEFHTTLDLTNVLSSDPETEIDSILTGTILTGTGDTLNEYRLDSVNYDKNLDFIYREVPSVAVTNPMGDPNFWEEEVIASDDSTLAVVDGSYNPLTSFPIFKQRERYEVKVSVFESYNNGTPGDASDDDLVPVSDGTVEITNDIAINGSTIQYELSDVGTVNYSFMAGLPNTLADYSKAMNVIAYTGNGGSIATPWLSGGQVFKGYVFGGMPTGSNFVTSGPTEVDMIIRDPHGTESFAWVEQNSTVSKTESFTTTEGAGFELGRKVSIGGKVETFLGVGAGVVTEVEVKNELTEKLKYEATWESGSTRTSTVTNTDIWQTSDSPEFVGAPGDVFIGHSTNIVYGISQDLTLMPTTMCGPENGCQTAFGDYSVGISKGLRVSPEFGTAFQYSQNHITNFLIPSLEIVRNLYLQTHPDLYTSTYPLGDEMYGSPNTSTTDTYTEGATDTIINIVGDSYTINRVIGGPLANWPSLSTPFVDSVEYYNQQIAGWENMLKKNEKEKVEAVTIQNLSFDGGVVYTSSTTTESEAEETWSHEIKISYELSNELGFTFNGVGASFTIGGSSSFGTESSGGVTTANSLTTGYELADSDEGDYYSIDVKEPESATAAIFSVQGGQSQCPYVDEEVTQYYQPGTPISTATVQRENPVISCDIPVQNNVPEDQAALFDVELGNIGNSTDFAWCVVSIDQSSNQNGALIKMDGAPIGNGQLVFIQSGQTIGKTISIEKTNPAINDYEDIGIIFHSDCQFDPGNSTDNIADTVFLTARFQPVCSGVEITDPANLWLRNVNTGEDLPITMEGYNLAHIGFEKVMFQYKATSSSAWITDMSFYANDSIFAVDSAAGITGQKINGAPQINYTFDMSSLQDREYDIRAITMCGDGTINSSTILTGVKDTKRPQVFGTPQPGDGILSAGEDVLITFDEPIEAGLLLGSNFSVRGVVNGSPLRHSSGLYFDGTTDNASNIAGVELTNKSFAIEMWTKRGDLTPGVLFQQGDVELGFDANDKYYVKIGGQVQSTTDAFAFTDKWIHITTSYDFNNQTVNSYMAYDGYNSVVMNNISFPNSFEVAGKVSIGNNGAESNGYNGIMHDFRIWNKTISYALANSNMIINLNGEEIGLVSFWPMNDLDGNIAEDLARSKQLTLNGPSWQIFPTGYSYDFAGSDHLSMNIQSTVITDEMDMTLEMWFKGTSQTNTVLFSNGRTDTTEQAQTLGRIWELGFDGNGNLYAKNNGAIIADYSEDYLDNEWHHLAVVLRRKGNTSIYVDGEVRAFENSANFGEFWGNRATIGASKHSNILSSDPYDKHFVGSIDEVRLWELSRTTKLLNMDMNSKLSGDETGLVAYYPFDHYDVNLILESTLKDKDYNHINDTLSTLELTSTGGAFDNVDVPRITDARPAQNLAFHWVVNNDAINIVIDEPASLVEKTVVEFTVDRIADLNENRIASPETWTAFIKQNTVLWDEDYLEYEIEYGEDLSFTVDVDNIGGLDQDYTISNIPDWLTVSSPTGNIPPTGTTTIDFEVSNLLNIGTYDEVLYLTSDFGFSEVLRLKIKVVGTPPDWELDPANFQYSMNVISTILIDSVVSIDPDDILVALVDGQVRGIAEPQYVSALDAYLTYLDIYSNVVNNELVEFHVWDASRGKLHTEIDTTLTLVSGDLVGTPTSPFPVNALNTVSEPIVVVDGWNWISFPLQSPNLTDVDATLSSLNAGEGDIVKGIDAYDQYGGSSLGWIGGLSLNGGFTNTAGYKLNSSVNDTIEHTGIIIDPSTVTFQIDSAWNWIGFVSTVNLSIEDAFSQYNPAHNDLLKSQHAFALYDSTLGWVGNLTHLQPKKGYMYKSQKEDSLIYPSSMYVAGSSAKADFGMEDFYNVLNVVPSNYEHTMNVIADVYFCDDKYSDVILMAYNENTPRGAARIVDGRAYLTIYANEDFEEITFKAVMADGEAYELNETIEFVSNDLRGSLDEPMNITNNMTAVECETIEESDITSDDGFSIMPTIFSEDFTISFNGNEDEKILIELYDLSGKKVAVLVNGIADEGVNTFRTKTLNDLASGAYLVKAQFGDKQVTQKVFKQ